MQSFVVGVALFVLASCSLPAPPSAATDIYVSPTPNSASVDINSSRPANIPLLQPVRPRLNLTGRERKYLDESIPPEVRKILERADKFEVLGEVDKDESSESDNRSFVPNRLVAISSDSDKREVLEAFYSDAAKEDSPAVCYEPHDAIKAYSADEFVEIEICFDCSRFIVKYGSKKYSGTIAREGRQSESIFDRILQRQRQPEAR